MLLFNLDNRNRQANSLGRRAVMALSERQSCLCVEAGGGGGAWKAALNTGGEREEKGEGGPVFSGRRESSPANRSLIDTVLRDLSCLYL